MHFNTAFAQLSSIKYTTLTTVPNSAKEKREEVRIQHILQSMSKSVQGVPVSNKQNKESVGLKVNVGDPRV